MSMILHLELEYLETYVKTTLQAWNLCNPNDYHFNWNKLFINKAYFNVIKQKLEKVYSILYGREKFTNGHLNHK